MRWPQQGDPRAAAARDRGPSCGDGVWSGVVVWRRPFLGSLVLGAPPGGVGESQSPPLCACVRSLSSFTLGLVLTICLVLSICLEPGNRPGLNDTDHRTQSSPPRDQPAPPVHHHQGSLHPQHHGLLHAGSGQQLLP